MNQTTTENPLSANSVTTSGDFLREGRPSVCDDCADRIFEKADNKGGNKEVALEVANCLAQTLGYQCTCPASEHSRFQNHAK